MTDTASTGGARRMPILFSRPAAPTSGPLGQFLLDPAGALHRWGEQLVHAAAPTAGADASGRAAGGNPQPTADRPRRRGGVVAQPARAAAPAPRAARPPARVLPVPLARRAPPDRAMAAWDGPATPGRAGGPGCLARRAHPDHPEPVCPAARQPLGAGWGAAAGRARVVRRAYRP